MKILTKAKNIRDALHALQPSKIAVAFVGTGWKKFISSERLDEIVLSPTLGSNPKAIEEIMEEIGAENVHFLDQLHSKIYLGDEAALLGSCNLSDNGLADVGLIEVAVLLDEPNALQQIEFAFEKYKEQAKQLYPSVEAKKERLRVLMKQWNIALWHGLTKPEDRGPEVAHYKSGLDRIHITGYVSGDYEFDSEAVTAAIPESKGISVDEFFCDAIQFLEEDSVEPGDWILRWHCRNDGHPRKGGDVSWMHVHYVVSHGFVDDTYTKLVGQAEHLKRGAPPFQLDKATKQLIRVMLSSGDFPELLSLNEDVWHLGPADAVTPRFLELLRSLAKMQ